MLEGSAADRFFTGRAAHFTRAPDGAEARGGRPAGRQSIVGPRVASRLPPRQLASFPTRRGKEEAEEPAVLSTAGTSGLEG
jgi:hypothetical protein